MKYQRAGQPTIDALLSAGAKPEPHDAAAREVARFSLADCACRVLCVDNVLPRHATTRHADRPRLLYAEGELVHFELEGHVYAVVPEAAAHDAAEAGCPLPAASTDIRELLTNRELQIVQLICMGCLTKQVADRLRISEFTVRSYLKTIYCKLGVRSRGALVYRYAQAFQRALVPMS
ncbi:MAG: LuxR C-terminal-related transcriptional regulator [Pseudomonadota bacterium]